MNDEVLTTERILDTAEEVLRRYGPAKTTVVDVARALGVSHGSVYRHFPSKVALREAVAKRWLDHVTEPLIAVVDSSGPATDRLKRWIQTLHNIKKAKVLNDPEMFATYHELATEAREVAREHVEHLTAQVERIIAGGVASGEFDTNDPAAAAQAFMYAMARFHHPVHSAEWVGPDTAGAFENVWSLVLNGLKTRK